MRRSIALRLSLLLNLVLVLGLGWRWRPTPTSRAGAAPERADSPPASVPAMDSPAAGPTSAGPDRTRFSTAAVDWSQFSTGDWFRYRDELLACGCPRATVRHILVPLVNRQFAGRFRKWAADLSARFWTVFCPPARQRKEAWNQEFDRLNSEREAMLQRLFPGEETEWKDAGVAVRDRRTDFLPPALAEAVLAAESNLEGLRQEARQTQSEPRVRDELVRQAEADFEAELARLLTPEQLTEWKARNSGRVAWLKNLPGIELSPAELAEIARLNPNEVEPTPAEKAAAEAQIRTLLGPERQAAFERAQDPVYQDLSALSGRTGLAESEVDSLWRFQRASEAEAERVVDDATLSAEQRTAELTRLRAEHEAAVQESLATHPGAFEAWQRQQAPWLKDVFSRPPADPLEEWLKDP